MVILDPAVARGMLPYSRLLAWAGSFPHGCRLSANTLELPFAVFSDWRRALEDRWKNAVASQPNLTRKQVLAQHIGECTNLVSKLTEERRQRLVSAMDLNHCRATYRLKAAPDELADFIRSQPQIEVVETDGSIEPGQMSLETAEVIESAGPWGQHFPEPVFDNRFEILDWKVVGEKHLKMQLRQDEGGSAVDAIAFNTLADDLPSFDRIHVAYRMNVNEFRNNRNLQLIVDCMSATEQ